MEVKDERLEHPHLFPGYWWYLEALKAELGQKSDFPVWSEIITRRNFCRNIRDQLGAGNKVHVLAWNDAVQFNMVAIPREVDRNGDWITLKPDRQWRS